MAAKKGAKRSKTFQPEAPNAWEDAYKARFIGSSFGNDAIGLFALALQYNLEDLDAIGAESITGGGNDKKCDLFYFDKEESRCVIAQCYVAQKPKASAPANKASDLTVFIHERPKLIVKLSSRICFARLILLQVRLHPHRSLPSTADLLP